MVNIYFSSSVTHLFILLTYGRGRMPWRAHESRREFSASMVWAPDRDQTWVLRLGWQAFRPWRPLPDLSPIFSQFSDFEELNSLTLRKGTLSSSLDVDFHLLRMGQHSLASVLYSILRQFLNPGYSHIPGSSVSVPYKRPSATLSPQIVLRSKFLTFPVIVSLTFLSETFASELYLTRERRMEKHPLLAMSVSCSFLLHQI